MLFSESLEVVTVLKFLTSDSHTFKTVSQELCPCDGTSQQTAAVPAEAPGAARLSRLEALPDQRRAQVPRRRLFGFALSRRSHKAV